MVRVSCNLSPELNAELKAIASLQDMGKERLICKILTDTIREIKKDELMQKKIEAIIAINKVVSEE